MQPNRLGRVLGVSARVAAEKLKEQAAKGTARPAEPKNAETASVEAPRPANSETSGQAGLGAAEAATAGPAEEKTGGPFLRSGVEALRRGSQAAVRAYSASTGTQSAERIVPGSAGRAVPTYASGGRRLARGAGRFGASLVRPFAHATGVLTLEITGVFFALFTLFFVEHAWLVYKGPGWRDGHFAIYAALAALFAWFATSSFWRAKRKQRGAIKR